MRLAEECRHNFRLFCESYFPLVFPFAWSADHLQVIELIQRVILESGQFSIGLPRGSGKTVLSERGTLWALLYGHRRYGVFIGATAALAEEMIDSVKMELTYNENLRRPFRHVCYPIRRLEFDSRKAGGQLFHSQRTGIEWKNDVLSFPLIPDEYVPKGFVNVAGSRIVSYGLTGSIRGRKKALPSGIVIRPDIAMIDDPQTRESAKSLEQTRDRMKLIHGDVLSLAGPGVKISALMPCTVIQEGDLADQLLDRQKNPQWQGVRTKSIISWPEKIELWETYKEILDDGLRTGEGEGEAIQFLTDNFKEMHEGSLVAWEDRKGEGDLSALHHLMNVRIRIGEDAFDAEFQNSPRRTDDMPSIMLSPQDVMEKVSGYPRFAIPSHAEKVTAFVDVHDQSLFYSVVAWSDRFDGWVVDYGIHPKQPRNVWTQRRLMATLGNKHPGHNKEAAIVAGLEEICGELWRKQWVRQDGGILSLGMLFIDSGYVPELVFDFIRASGHTATAHPSRGVHIGAAGKPMTEYSRRRGDRIGWNWYLPPPIRGRGVRQVRFDSNFWKSFLMARLAAPTGEPGALRLFGKPEDHQGIAEHVTSEVPIRTSGQGRVVDEWMLKPNMLDNHWLDCLVGACVAASFIGIKAPGEVKVAHHIAMKLSDTKVETAARVASSLATSDARRPIKLSSMRK